MQSFFARRTAWNLATNRYTEALEAHRRAGRELLDLTASNPTTVGLRYREEELLRALARREVLVYDPQPKGLLAAREASAFTGSHCTSLAWGYFVCTCFHCAARVGEVTVSLRM